MVRAGAVLAIVLGVFQSIGSTVAVVRSFSEDELNLYFLASGLIGYILAFALVMAGARIYIRSSESFSLTDEVAEEERAAEKAEPKRSYQDMKLIEAQGMAIRSNLIDDDTITVKEAAKLIKTDEKQAHFVLESQVAKAILEFDEKTKSYKLR